MLTIGAFARLGGVSPRALRHYEGLGLLAPASIDPSTGYRYYRAAQLARVHRIQALQDLGLSLQQIQPLLDGGVSARELTEMLEAKREELARRVAEDTDRLDRVERRLRYIELEDDVSIDFTIKHIPTIRVAQSRLDRDEGVDFYGVPDFAVVAGPALGAALHGLSIERTGPVLFHYEEREDGSLTPIIAMPIGDQPVPHDAAFEVAELPPIDAVVTIHSGTGDHDLIGPLYGQMARYAERHGYTVDGPGRDNLVSYGSGDEMVFELQLPVARAVAP